MRKSTLRYHFISLFLSICFASTLFSQSPTQTIRGTITDRDNQQPLTGATILLKNTDLGTITDEKGQYRLPTIPVGRYQMEISHLGYEKLLITEILVEAGKEVVQNIQLSESQTELSEVVVKAPREQILHPVSTKTITIEETFRFPATFYDPARLATSFAGTVNDNDQANGISIRGNSPNGLSWRLEGVEIVNPNHTPNAGTFSDRITQNGGGVNILSAQMLGTSNFLTGAFPAQYGNALSGILDMNLRKGNDEQHEFIGQIGLIGIDVAAEGPISKNSKSSYLLNYRYSTIGLLSAMGVPLGDEEISFQDLAFHLSFPTQKTGTFTLFGMGGLSKNIFEAERDNSLWEFQKDRFDIRFENKMGALGLTHTLPIGNKSILKTVLATSATESLRTADRLSDNLEITRLETDDYFLQKTAISSIFSHKFNALHRLKFGIDATINSYNLSIQDNEFGAEGTQNATTIQSFINWNTQIAPELQMNVGLHYLYFTLFDSQSVEPRLSLSYQFSPKQNFSFAYGLHSQLQTPQVYFQRLGGVGGEFPLGDIGLTKAHHFVLGYKNQLTASTVFRTEIYYQSLFNIPIDIQTNSTFSLLNFTEGLANDRTLRNEGTGENYGVEVSLQKYFTKGYYFLFNATWYEAKYTAQDDIKRDTRFNGNYITNLTIGKEWTRTKKEKPSIWGVNVRVVYLGGFRTTPINIAASRAAGRTIYFEEQAFSEQLPAYFKTDLRIYWKRSKRKRNQTLALDVQNLTNQQNVAFDYFDTEQGEVIRKFQLGTIPILTYRVEF